MAKKFLDFSGLTAYDVRIKNLIGEKVGYASTELDTTSGKTFIYFFQSKDTYEEWASDKVGNVDNIKFSCELPKCGCDQTYPVESDCTISGNDKLSEKNKDYEYNLSFNKPYYTGKYSITWAIGDLVDGEFVENTTLANIKSTSIDGKSCTVYTVANPTTEEKTTLRILINCEDGSTVTIYKPILVAIKFMAQFGDVYLSNGKFVRPVYTYDGNGIVSGVTIPFAPGDIPIGVTIVPASHTIDKKARVMSLAEMSTTTPDTGAFTHETMNWGGYGQDITDLPNLDKVPDYSRLGSETKYNSNFSYHNSGETGDGLWYSTNSLHQMCPSPFNGTSPFEPDAELNPWYVKPGTATADYDGRGNTDKILAHMTDESWNTSETIHKTSSSTPSDSANYYPAAACCWRYHTSGTTQGEWYLPSCGELGYIIPRMNTLNKILNAIPNANGGTSKALSLDTDSLYWSSSEYRGNGARIVYTYYGNVSYSSKYGYLCVRAVLAV